MEMAKRPPIRLSISLDDETAKLIEKIQSKLGTSKAEVVRLSVGYLNVAEEKGGVPLSTVNACLDFLAKGEHVIVDVEHWHSLFKEIGNGSENFWKEVREVGKNHWKEYHDKGLRNVRDVLDYVEKTNWYTMNVDSEHDFTLILRVPSSKRFVRTFFEGLFDASPYQVKISESYGKIRMSVVT